MKKIKLILTNNKKRATKKQKMRVRKIDVTAYGDEQMSKQEAGQKDEVSTFSNISPSNTN